MEANGTLSDNTRRWTILAIAGCFVAFWTVFPTLSQPSLDVHGDMVENYAWGIAWQLGYYKHPPLFAWITAEWFAVFPRADWAYNLLSAINSAVGLTAMWFIARRYLTRDQRLLAAGLWFFLPPLTFLAATYNATSAMIPFWALMVLAYLRLLESRRAFDAALLGLFAGLAMLAKYHSIVIALAVLAHAMSDREARPVLLSWLAPIAAGVAALVFLPHLVWLVRHDFLPVRYADNQGSGDIGTTLVRALEFPLAIYLYMIPPAILVLAYFRPRDGWPFVTLAGLRGLGRTLAGRALIVLGCLPPVLTWMLAIFIDAELSSLWAIPFYWCTPIFLALLVPAPIAGGRRWTVFAGTGVALAVLLALSPFIRSGSLASARSNEAVPTAALAAAIESAWRVATGVPLRIVGGDQFLANAETFYGADRPYAIQGSSLALTPWVTAADISRDGAAYLCRGELADCGGLAKSVLGKVDSEQTVTVDALPGAAGPAKWTVEVAMQYPAKP